MLQRNGLFCLGSQTYSLMRNLLSPDKPGDKSFSELVELLRNYYNPTLSEIVQQRFKFNSRNRQPNETVADYVAVLRELAQHCNYGDNYKRCSGIGWCVELRQMEYSVGCWLKRS